MRISEAPRNLSHDRNGNGTADSPLPPLGDGRERGKSWRRIRAAQSQPPPPRPEGPQPLPAVGGGGWLPTWTMRPGSYKEVKAVAPALPLWKAIYSLTGQAYGRPCHASRETLALTTCTSLSTVQRQIRILEDAHLLFSVEQPRDSKGRCRPPLRWAVDPLSTRDENETWRPKLERQLRAIAERDGWAPARLDAAIAALDGCEAHCQRLAALMHDQELVYEERKKKRKQKVRRDGRLADPRATPQSPPPATVQSDLQGKIACESNWPARGGEVGRGGEGGSVEVLKKNGRTNPDDVVLKKGPPTNGDGVVLTRAQPDSVGKRADSIGMVPELRAGSEMLCNPSPPQGEFEVRSREAAEDTMRNTGESQTSLDLPRSPLPYQDPGDSR